SIQCLRQYDRIIVQQQQIFSPYAFEGAVIRERIMPVDFVAQQPHVRKSGANHFACAVRGGVVDNDHLIGSARRIFRYRAETIGEKLTSIVRGDNNGNDKLGSRPLAVEEIPIRHVYSSGRDARCRPISTDGNRTESTRVSPEASQEWTISGPKIT